MEKEALPRGLPRKRNRKLQKNDKPSHVISVKDSPLVVPPTQFKQLKKRSPVKVEQNTHGKIRHIPKKRHKGQIIQEFVKYSLEGILETDCSQD